MPGSDPASDPKPAGCVAREYRGRKTIFAVVRDADRFFLVGDADDRDNGTEAFVVVQAH